MYYDVHESNAGQTPGAYLEFGAQTHDGQDSLLLGCAVIFMIQIPDRHLYKHVDDVLAAKCGAFELPCIQFDYHFLSSYDY